MYNEEEIKKKLKVDIGKKRFKHSLRVAKLAKELAINYGVDHDKAYIAGLTHDCAKYNEKFYINKFDIDISNYPVLSIKDPILHSFLGAEVVKKVYNIDDEDIVEAIKYHTTAKDDMNMLEKIIFIADSIEPARNFKGIEEIRNESFRDLDETMLMLLDSNIKFLIYKKALINPLTFIARNYLIEEKNG
ncbi:bis(5'-nucleosyl)-tetraphosphatase (symmetrical) YqeK [uncultured Anaerococcus sp.]|uniref:bis(5'-nucleosyl)-tetraphosphatase (symmetrical) YqeK n=1 Tax=uncultured Anaerococcus sp. TaxID=293428 RepID=UPI0025DAC662|nr:bis(5'-nucleosyl)-tetraphosphatase (symmetrical) YqeK [uncultured Anaerococcus sp.]